MMLNVQSLVTHSTTWFLWMVQTVVKHSALSDYAECALSVEAHNAGTRFGIGP